MTFLEIVKKRFSVRNYSPEPVEEEKLLKIFEAAKWAPSACNNQPCYSIIITDNAKKQLMRPAYNRDWFINAPVIIAVCVDMESAWCRNDGTCYGYVDAAIVMDHITLAATELGLGTCWIGAFKRDEVKKALSLPDNVEPVVMTPLGYTNQEPTERNRKSIEETVFWNVFGKKK
jgi:nitroreductase